MRKVLLMAIAVFYLLSCKKSPEKGTNLVVDSENDFTELSENAKLLFGTLPEVAENPENPITADKVALGQKLYHDVRLSKDNTISCNSCHNLNTYGVDNLPVSPGNDEGTFGGRNSPTVLNAALHISQFWDGRAKDVEEQAGGPILNPVEMAMQSEEAVEKRISNIEEYGELFAKAFPKDKNPISYENIQKAIGAFERKLITPTKFDDFLAGDYESLNNKEKEGLNTFIEVGCTACHMGNNLGGNMYQKFGLFGDYWEETGADKIDKGRFDVTQNEADKYFFKVPSLRNIVQTYPYFHDGSVEDLEEAIQIMAKTQTGKELSDKQIKDIVIFLNTLTGEVPEEYRQ